MYVEIGLCYVLSLDPADEYKLYADESSACYIKL
jgi:hypothetical protein